VVAPLRALFGMTSDLGARIADEPIEAFLQRTNLFGGLDARELRRLAAVVHVRSFEDGEYVYEQGRPGAALFLLRSGKVEISRREADGRDAAIAVLLPPASFEEMAALDREVVRWTSARSIGRSELLAMGRSDLESFAGRWPATANKVLLRLAEAVASRTRAVLEANGVLRDLPP
jgi:CRP/FNR family cyclic AMP-dependent transcriptional regulator